MVRRRRTVSAHSPLVLLEPGARIRERRRWRAHDGQSDRCCALILRPATYTRPAATDDDEERPRRQDDVPDNRLASGRARVELAEAVTLRPARAPGATH
jgi:hypothetical protein